MRWPVASVMFVLAAAACGSDAPSGTDPGNNTIAAPNATNVAAIVVDAGPNGASGSPVGYVNGAFVTVTVCIPGTASCQDIDHVLVDTGSSGLRLLANDGRAGGELNLALPEEKDAAGNTVAECAQFLDGFTWGPVLTADLKIAGERAQHVPVQLISQVKYSVPASCESVGIDEGTLEGSSGLGVNGILGVGLFLQDCGGACAIDPSAGNPGVYYACSSSGCASTAVATSAQVTNPVSLFPVDNNGVIIELPIVGPSGAPRVTGSLVFGIGTQPNNNPGSATVFPVDSGGNIATLFPLNGTSYGSFIDSGSNGIFFLSGRTSGIPVCSGTGGIDGFYCPAAPLALSAANQGNGSNRNAQVNFAIANAQTLLATNNSAFGNLGGPSTSTTPQPGQPESFDWGLPFFLGRNVFTAIEGARTPAGSGPYFAY